MTDESNRPLKVFLCHAHSDAAEVRALHARLHADGVAAWLDKENIVPGQDWDYEIRKAVRESDIVIVCLSKQFNQKGYRQNEVRVALEEANMQPEGEIFIIPARLEECDYPESLRRFHGVDLYEERGYEYLMRALRLRAEKIGAALQSKKGWLGGFTSPLPKKPAERKPPRAEKRTSTPMPVKRDAVSVKKKSNVQIIVAVVGAAATIAAAILGSLPWGTWFAPASETPYVTVTTQATAAATSSPTKTPVPPTNTPALPTNTPALPTNTPAPDFGSFILSDGVKMMYVPAGAFTMGSDRFDDEKPVHTVTLDAYYIDQTEVTNAAYKHCVDAGKCQPPKNLSSQTRDSYYGNSLYDEYPVVYVDWNMANTYCEWREARLPTEAEWEKAARSTDGRTYPWGENIDCTLANYYDNTNNRYCVGDTTMVKSYENGKSAYGVYDMAGNVREWVNDWYDKNYYKDSPSSNPLGPSSGQSRVLRGGSWLNFDNYVRSALRYDLTPVNFDNFIGFRCARSAASP